jgi:hypothetical protein
VATRCPPPVCHWALPYFFFVLRGLRLVTFDPCLDTTAWPVRPLFRSSAMKADPHYPEAACLSWVPFLSPTDVVPWSSTLPAILSIDWIEAARAYSLCGGSSPRVRTCRRFWKHWCMNFCLKPRPNSSLTQSPRSFGSRAVTTTASGASILPLNVGL